MLQKYLEELDSPVPQDMAKRVISYMKGLPPQQSDLIMQCAEFLDHNMTKRDILTVAYALNGGEILFKCQEDALSDELSLEFERLLNDGKKD